MKSFFIPQKEKPLLPTRQKFPYLYKYLDQKKADTSAQSLYKSLQTEESFREGERQQTLKNEFDKFANTTKSFVTSLSKPQSRVRKFEFY
mgnify:CR=1 FL=1